MSDSACVLRWVLVAALVAIAPPASAQEPTAKELAQRAYEHFVDGQFQKAIDLLQDARKKAPIPTINLIEARANVKLGRFVEAARRYREAASWTPSPDDPKPFRQAIEDAKRELPEVEAKIGRLRVTITGDATSAAAANVLVDGVERAALEADIELNPGKHQIEVRGLRSGEQRRSITLAEGESIALSFDAGAPPPPGRDYVPAAVTFGASGAALLVGAIMGGLAIAEKGTLDERCEGQRCDASLEPIHARAVTYSWVSTLSFVLGGAGLVGGTFAAIYAPDKASPAGTTGLRAQLGPTGGGASWFVTF